MKKIMLLFALCLSFVATAQKATTDCSKITRDPNAPEGEVHYVTPETDGVSLTKIVDAVGDNVTYIGSVTVPSKTKIKGTGVMLLFENGDFINYPDAEVLEKRLSDGTFEYIAVFLIEKGTDINYFGASGIKGVRVVEAMKAMTKGIEIQKLSACLISKK